MNNTIYSMTDLIELSGKTPSEINDEILALHHGVEGLEPMSMTLATTMLVYTYQGHDVHPALKKAII